MFITFNIHFENCKTEGSFKVSYHTWRYMQGSLSPIINFVIAENYADSEAGFSVSFDSI